MKRRVIFECDEDELKSIVFLAEATRVVLTVVLIAALAAGVYLGVLWHA